MEKYSVVLLPDHLKIEVEAGTTLLEAARQAGIHVKSTCGGKGTCGKCTVKVMEGKVSGGHGNIPAQLREEGFILACTAVIESDVQVEIPEEFRLHEHQVLLEENGEGVLAEGKLDILGEYPLNPLAEKFYIELSPPNLTENISDYSRLITELKKHVPANWLNISNDVLKTLPDILRAGDWKVTVTVAFYEGGGEIVRITPGKDDFPAYGIAVDAGTTTVVVALIDLATGAVLAKQGTYNRQADYGDDVISRIIYADEFHGLEKLQQVVIETVNDLLDKIFAQYHVSIEEIPVVVVAGNTTMTHLFLGINPKYIRLEPYIPAAAQYPVVKAKEIGLKINPQGLVFNFPSVASYVGGDIVSGALVAELDKREEITLFIDIGTNGEMVLGNKDWLMCCACSAGPAFEGGGITHGMRAMPGAIERVNINRKTFKVKFQTVGDLPPVGICGSGLIDCLAKLRVAGIIDRSGKIQDVDTPRIRKGDDGPEFILAFAEESGIDQDIVITESDIKNLIRAKGAIFAGVRIMLTMADLPVEAIDRILIAGGFGNYLNVPDSIRIGLLPDLPRDKFDFIGNSSLKGAHLALLSREAFGFADDLGRSMTYLELSLGNAFMDEYVSALFLPHTDLSLFPSVKE
ncbi:ASKHA domain-containing protein [Candidatus Formimonas warabiya]|uniref:Ferredoxin n=1 Tax=Formimonas warabiya TaxID=1761012 RepID=A0A3G1KPH8_FORW1|nr:ASKHA domain-containing protein [Candidatus Formimonas warabiya]ATW24372.1 ferredoxin [Candidatus Formimonas warabiya]